MLSFLHSLIARVSRPRCRMGLRLYTRKAESGAEEFPEALGFNSDGVNVAHIWTARCSNLGKDCERCPWKQALREIAAIAGGIEKTQPLLVSPASHEDNPVNCYGYVPGIYDINREAICAMRDEGAIGPWDDLETDAVQEHGISGVENTQYGADGCTRDRQPLNDFSHSNSPRLIPR